MKKIEEQPDVIVSSGGTLEASGDGFMFPAQGERGAVFIKAATIEEATVIYNSLTT
jgi:hypothetical protein